MRSKTRALVRVPGANLTAGISEFAGGKPDFELARRQHETYCNALSACGLTLIELASDPHYPDGCFVEDTAVVVDETRAIITNPGHPARQGETSAVAAALRQYLRLDFIQLPGTVDGGDILEVGDHYFIGLSKRTNENGAQQLAHLLSQYGKTTSTMEVAWLLHLKSGITCLSQDLIVCVADYERHSALEEYEDRIIVPASETLAANCLDVNGTVLLPLSCPRTEAQLQARGRKTVALDLSEFHKLDAAFTCLSIIF